MSEGLIRKVSTLLTREEQLKLMIWIGELEVLRDKGDESVSEKLIKKTEEEHQLAVNSVLMEIIEERELRKSKITQQYEPQRNLLDEPKPAYTTQAGVVTMFSKAMVVGHPRDAISYYLNKRGRKNKYGKFLGFIITDIPSFLRTTVQPVSVYFVKEAAIERRKELMRWRKAHRITKLDYDLHLKHNTLIHFFEGREILTPKERNRRRNIDETRRLYKRKLKDELQNKKQTR